MINFEEIVLSSLIEEEVILEAATPMLGSNFAQQWDDSNSQVLGNLRDYFFNTFNIDRNWPASNKIFAIARDQTVRQRADSLVEYAEHFPLLDFLWYLITETGFDPTKVDLDDTKITNHAKNFQNLCYKSNQGPNINPLFGYSPITSVAVVVQRPLQKKISNQLIGKLSLQNCNDKSIKDTLYFLLEARKKVRTSILQKPIPSAIPFIDKILINPQSYAGKVQIPPELRSVYDRTDGETIIELAQTMQDFFESESATASSAKGKGNLLNTKDVKLKNTLMEFISNNLKKHSPNDNIFTFIKSNKPFYAPGNISNTMPGGYNIANIRTINTPQAKALIKELESFANYISEGEPKDRAGKFQRAAQGTASALKSISSAIGPTPGW
jgi:hypothetical protein